MSNSSPLAVSLDALYNNRCQAIVLTVEGALQLVVHKMLTAGGEQWSVRGVKSRIVKAPEGPKLIYMTGSGDYFFSTANLEDYLYKKQRQMYSVYSPMGLDNSFSDYPKIEWKELSTEEFISTFPHLIHTI